MIMIAVHALCYIIVRLPISLALHWNMAICSLLLWEYIKLHTHEICLHSLTTII